MGNCGSLERHGLTSDKHTREGQKNGKKKKNIYIYIFIVEFGI
jgi:hypothetical protein